MPSAPRLHLTCHGRKPSRARLPGLDTSGMLCGRYGPGRLVWRFCCHGLYAN